MTEFEQAKAWRERQGLSIAELAELTGFSTAAISMFENGKTPTTRGGWRRYKLLCFGVRLLKYFGKNLDEWPWS